MDENTQRFAALRAVLDRAIKFCGHKFASEPLDKFFNKSGELSESGSVAKTQIRAVRYFEEEVARQIEIIFDKTNVAEGLAQLQQVVDRAAQRRALKDDHHPENMPVKLFDMTPVQLADCYLAPRRREWLIRLEKKHEELREKRVKAEEAFEKELRDAMATGERVVKKCSSYKI